MRLLGFSFEGASGPVKKGYVPLGELTAVIGANDVGKSRLVRTFAAALAQDPKVGAGRLIFFAECEGPEMPSLLRSIRDWSESIRPAFQFAEEDAERKEADQDPVGSTVAAIAETQPDVRSEAWRMVCMALAGSRRFALEAAADRLAWTLHWCAPAPDHLEPDVRDALIEVQRRTRGESGDELTRPQSGPQPVIRLGVVPLSWLPRPVFLPLIEEDVATRATASVADLARLLEVADSYESAFDLLKAGTVEVDGALVFPESLYRHLLAEPDPASPAADWIDESDIGSTRVKDEVITSCELIATIATCLAPPLIHDRYWFQVSVTPKTVYSSPAPVEIRLALRDDTPDGERERPAYIDHWAAAPFGFRIDELADGYRIWTQLAILQTLDLVATLTDHLLDLAETIWLAAEGVARWTAIQAEEEAAEPGVALDQAKRKGIRARGQSFLDKHIAQQRESLTRGVTRFNEALILIRVGDGDRLVGSFIHPFARPRAPMFLVDEPERHLHPRAQRALAAWLRDLVREHRTQALLTTHAVPFGPPPVWTTRLGCCS